MDDIRRWGLVVTAVMMTSLPSMAASNGQAVSIEQRVRGAGRVVVATVADTTARYEQNEFGDQLIVTEAHLAVEEVLKGIDGPLTLALEGGTVGGITLRVSDLPGLRKGERAVFFVRPDSTGRFQPHLRGQGILKLDATDRVVGSSLTLVEIRRLTRDAAKGAR